MALTGDTQLALVLVVQRVEVQDSTYMAGEGRAEGDTESTPLALAEIPSWRDTGFLGKHKVRAHHSQFGNTYMSVLVSEQKFQIKS